MVRGDNYDWVRKSLVGGMEPRRTRERSGWGGGYGKQTEAGGGHDVWQVLQVSSTILVIIIHTKRTQTGNCNKRT